MRPLISIWEDQPPRFQFTHPGRGATIIGELSVHTCNGFNSRTPGGVRPSVDLMTLLSMGFNSRTPGGVRPEHTDSRSLREMFQFTHPGRGATPYTLNPHSGDRSFNSRTPGGVRRVNLADECVPVYVSIHAPREGCDGAIIPSYQGAKDKFQFTHPGRGATTR